MLSTAIHRTTNARSLTRQSAGRARNKSVVLGSQHEKRSQRF